MSGSGLWVEIKNAVGSTLVQWGVSMLSTDARAHLFTVIVRARKDAGVSR